MTTSLTAVPECEGSPDIIGSTEKVPVCGEDPRDCEQTIQELAASVRCLSAELSEAKRKIAILQRESLKKVTSPSESLTGITINGNSAIWPPPIS